MFMTRKFAFCLMTAVLAVSLSGCNLLHNLKPHRLQRLNQGPGMRPASEAYSLYDAHGLSLITHQS